MRDSITYWGGNELAYSDIGRGDGYPVLVQHGLIASIDDSDLFERLVGLGVRVISVARPGYGASSPYALRSLAEWADVVGALVDALGLAQFDVLGISSGAPYAYAIGRRYPDRVRNLFILSGIPALYDDEVLRYWPYPVDRNAGMPEMQKLAHELFFSHLSPQDLEKNDVRDSMANDCFGIAQDLRIRVRDWGFRLSDVKATVYMRHSRADESFVMVEMTSRLLPNCAFEAREHDAHFSREVLDDFIETVMARHYEG